MDPARVLVWPRDPWEGEFLSAFRLEQPNNESKAEIDTAQALLNGERMEKWELSSQIKFSPREE